MAKRGYSAEQITGMLREAEVLNGQGQSIEQICRGPGVTPTTYYRWHKEYGGDVLWALGWRPKVRACP